MRRLSCLIALLACLVLALPAFAAPQKADAISGISSEKVLDIVKANKGKLVFINFFATWCGPCKMLAPTLDEVAAETAGKAAVYKLDIDQSPDIAQKYGVMSVPTLMVFENGQVKNQAVGVQPKQNILSMIG